MPYPYLSPHATICAVGVKGYGIAVFIDVAGDYGEHRRGYECIPPEGAGVVEAEEVRYTLKPLATSSKAAEVALSRAGRRV